MATQADRDLIEMYAEKANKLANIKLLRQLADDAALIGDMDAMRRRIAELLKAIETQN